MSTSLQIVVRVSLAMLCGGLVGLERELTDHPAGIRTHILVTVGSCVFTAMSLYGFPGFLHGDRVAAAVVTGIGFIGGGAILRSREGWVTGLTTAASLWSVAAVGMLFGTGYYAIGFVITGIDLVVLELIDRLMDAVSPRVKYRTMNLKLAGSYTEENLDQVMSLLDESRCHPQLVHLRRFEDEGKMDVSMLTRIAAGVNLQDLTGKLLAVAGISEVHWG